VTAYGKNSEGVGEGFLGRPILVAIIHEVFSLARDWSKRITEYPSDIPQLSNPACCEKHLKDKRNSLRLVRKCARMFVPGHYLFLKAQFSSLLVNCSLLKTDNVRGQTSDHISAPNGGYCLAIVNI